MQIAVFTWLTEYNEGLLFTFRHSIFGKEFSIYQLCSSKLSGKRSGCRRILETSSLIRKALQNPHKYLFGDEKLGQKIWTHLGDDKFGHSFLKNRKFVPPQFQFYQPCNIIISITVLLLKKMNHNALGGISNHSIIWNTRCAPDLLSKY